MGNIRGKIESIKKRLIVAGAFFVASSAFSGASAQNVTQDKQQDRQENVISKKNEGKSYCNLAGKVWNMYIVSSNGGGIYDTKEDISKCKDFFKKHPDIEKICQNANNAIGGSVRGIPTLGMAERCYPNLRSELNSKLSSVVINEIDGVGDVKSNPDKENVTDIVWRMYTHVSTHGGVGKQNQCADFFKNYPQLYKACQDVSLAVRNTSLPLERATYGDVMYYNKKSDGTFNFDKLVDNTLNNISSEKGITKTQIISEAKNVNVPNAELNNVKVATNAFSLGY